MSKVPFLSIEWNQGVLSKHLYAIPSCFLCQGYLLDACSAPCTETSRYCQEPLNAIVF